MKWPGGAGALVNLGEAYTTFVLACGVRVTRLYFFFFLMCMWICVYFSLHEVSLDIWVFECVYMSFKTASFVFCVWIGRYVCIYVYIFV